MADQAYILFVDDEKENLLSFKALFRRKYAILVAENAEEAMEKVEQFPVRLVLSDQRMPGMQGLELLEWVQNYDQDIVRMLISGSISVENKLEAMDEGLIHNWVEKPWKVSELEEMISEAWKKIVDRKE